MPTADERHAAASSVVRRYRDVRRLDDEPHTQARLQALLDECSVREGLRRFRLGAYRGVDIHVLDESSLMHTGTLKSIDGCVSTARAKLAGYDRICFESGGNTGTALTTYAGRAGLETFCFVPASSLAMLDSRPFAQQGAHLIAVDDPSSVKAAAAAFSAWTGVPHVPRPEWRIEASMFIGCFVLEEIRAGSRFDVIYQGISAAFAPLGIYRVLRAQGLDPLPRFVGVQQAARAPMVRRWLERTGGSFAAHGALPLTPVMYDAQPQEYGTYDELERLIRDSAGHLATVDHAEFERLNAPFDGASSVFEKLDAHGLVVTRSAGAVLDKTGLLGLARLVADIDSGAVTAGTSALACVTGGTAAPDGMAKPDYWIRDDEDHAARIADALGVDRVAHV